MKKSTVTWSLEMRSQQILLEQKLHGAKKIGHCGELWPPTLWKDSTYKKISLCVITYRWSSADFSKILILSPFLSLSLFIILLSIYILPFPPLFPSLFLSGPQIDLARAGEISSCLSIRTIARILAPFASHQSYYHRNVKGSILSISCHDWWAIGQAVHQFDGFIHQSEATEGQSWQPPTPIIMVETSKFGWPFCISTHKHSRTYRHS